MRLNNIKKAFLASAALLSAMSMSAAERFVSFKQGDLLINGNDKVEIYMDANDCRGVSYAANALVRDISKVSGSQATITSNQKEILFSHANENVRPGYYAVKLQQPNVWVELTATQRAGFQRYTFIHGDRKSVV